MKLRSLLFVPGDRPDRMEKAGGVGADAIILDLEDSVSAANKEIARAATLAFLSRGGHSSLRFVRINPIQSGMADLDLQAIIGGRPDAIVLPKAEGAKSLAYLDERLKELGDTTAAILPIVTETPTAMFRLGEYGGVTERLLALTWGAEDLPVALGAFTAREEDGSYAAPYQLARSLTLFGAVAANVQPIETIYPSIKDLDGLARYAARGARDGFTGMMAIHPSQVPVINAAFTPSDVEIEHARAVIEAFDANPGAGALQLNGKMLDAPHLKQARQILMRAGR